MLKPKYVEVFPGFPDITEHKKWKNNTTFEQIVFQKLLNQQDVNDHEKEIFIGLRDYYVELQNKLKLIDYNNLNDEELLSFAGYIAYALNFLCLIGNEIILPFTYRLVVNESVLGKAERIKELKYLTNPPLSVNQKHKLLNRANTSETTVFYTCEDINTCLLERKPEVGQIVTLGRKEILRQLSILVSIYHK